MGLIKGELGVKIIVRVVVSMFLSIPPSQTLNSP